jgi:hypothetical protein
MPFRREVRKELEVKEIDEVKEIKESAEATRMGRLGGRVVDNSRAMVARITVFVKYYYSTMHGGMRYLFERFCKG